MRIGCATTNRLARQSCRRATTRGLVKTGQSIARRRGRVAERDVVAETELPPRAISLLLAPTSAPGVAAEGDACADACLRVTLVRGRCALLLAGCRVLCLAGDPCSMGFAPAPRGRRDPVAPASQEHGHVLSVGTTPGSLTARWARPALDHRRARGIRALAGREVGSEGQPDDCRGDRRKPAQDHAPDQQIGKAHAPQLLSARETRAADGRRTLAPRNAVVKTGVPACVCQCPCCLRDDRARVRMRAWRRRAGCRSGTSSSAGRR
jgi:hypothetical protein